MVRQAKMRSIVLPMHAPPLMHSPTYLLERTAVDWCCKRLKGWCHEKTGSEAFKETTFRTVTFSVCQSIGRSARFTQHTTLPVSAMASEQVRPRLL